MLLHERFLFHPAQPCEERTINSPSSSPGDGQLERQVTQNLNTHKCEHSYRQSEETYVCNTVLRKKSLGSLNRKSSCHAVSQPVCNTQGQQRWEDFIFLTEVRSPRVWKPEDLGSSPKSPSASLTQIHLLLTTTFRSILHWKAEILQASEQYSLQNKDGATLKRCVGKRQLLNCPPCPDSNNALRHWFMSCVYWDDGMYPITSSQTVSAKPMLQYNCVEIMATKHWTEQSTFSPGTHQPVTLLLGGQQHSCAYT